MRAKVSGYAAALIVALTTQCISAADAVQANVVVRVARAQPTHRLVETARLAVGYGSTARAIGFTPGASEREPVGPSAFDVDGTGAYVVADPVHQRIVRVAPQGGTGVVTRLATLPLPLSELAVDRDGWIYVTDLRSRLLTTITATATSRTPLGGKRLGTRFVRQGDEVVLSQPSASRQLHRGALRPAPRSVTVRKCNAEAFRVTAAPSGDSIQIEIGGPLASVRLLGVNATGDVFVVVERFVKRGQLAVTRQVLVLSPTGVLKARLEVLGEPTLHPERELVLGPDGALHRMVPGDKAVSFQRWEVQP